MFQAVLSHPKTSAYPAHSYLQLIGQSRFAFARLVADQSLSASNFAIRAGLRGPSVVRAGQGKTLALRGWERKHGANYNGMGKRLPSACKG